MGQTKLGRKNKNKQIGQAGRKQINKQSQKGRKKNAGKKTSLEGNKTKKQEVNNRQVTGSR